MTIDWRTAYDNRAAAPDAQARHTRWAEAAAAFRTALGAGADRLSIGPGPRDRVDMFRPEGAPRGLAVFVHGGYWMRNDPGGFSHLAAGALARDWAVAMPAYPLCPDVRIAVITAHVARAITAAAAEVAGPIRLAGHSAGGHLAARMVTPGGLAPEMRERVSGVLAISGIHDLRPLIATPMNETLGLDLAAARAESPALMEPACAAGVTVWAGADELPELRRQSTILAAIWGGLGTDTLHVEAPGEDHFSVIEALGEPESALSAAWAPG